MRRTAFALASARDSIQLPTVCQPAVWIAPILLVTPWPERDRFRWTNCCPGSRRQRAALGARASSGYRMRCARDSVPLFAAILICWNYRLAVAFGYADLWSVAAVATLSAWAPVGRGHAVGRSWCSDCHSLCWPVLVFGIGSVAPMMNIGLSADSSAPWLSRMIAILGAGPAGPRSAHRSDRWLLRYPNGRQASFTVDSARGSSSSAPSSGLKLCIPPCARRACDYLDRSSQVPFVSTAALSGGHAASSPGISPRRSGRCFSILHRARAAGTVTAATSRSAAYKRTSNVDYETCRPATARPPVFRQGPMAPFAPVLKRVEDANEIRRVYDSVRTGGGDRMNTTGGLV